MVSKSTNPIKNKRSKASSASLVSSDASSLSGAQSLFGEDERTEGSTPFKRVIPLQTKPAKPFPKITLESAFLRQQATADAIFILRVLGNQYARQGQPKGQSAMIQREIQLKQGECEAEILARDALICKFLRNK